MSDDMDDMMGSDEEESVRILPPNFDIKKKIGMNVNIHEIFTPERIAAAQKAIDDTQAEFVNWVQNDLDELATAYLNMKEDPKNATEKDLTKVRKISFSIKCQAGTFGFALGSDVAKSLYNYVVKHEEYDENIVVIGKHVEALNIIFQQNIQGDGAKIGEELADNLGKLVAKYE